MSVSSKNSEVIALGIVELLFDYEFPKKVVYDWWTDLFGRGYIGKALKSLKPVGSEGEKSL